MFVLLGFFLATSPNAWADAPPQDVGLQAAIEKHNKELEKIEKDFDAAKAKRDKAHAAARKALIDAYKAAVTRATKKGDLAAAIAIQTELKSLQEADEKEPLNVEASKPAESAKMATKDLKRIPKNAYFRSMLGVYKVRSGNYLPFVNITTPKANIWTDHIKEQMRGKISLDNMAYQGHANFEIPHDGTYTVTFDRHSSAKIDGQDTGGSGDIALRKGSHEILLEPSGYDLTTCEIKIVDKQSREEVPLFNSWQAIQQFLATPIEGVKVTEVSGWQPTESNRVTFGKKK
jgi:hypothetical protein